MVKLIALIPILYLSKLYQPGEELPANNPDIIQAWIENKAAVWEGNSNIADRDNAEEEENKDSSDAEMQREDVTERESSLKAGEESDGSNTDTEEKETENTENILKEEKSETPQQEIKRRNNRQ